MAGNKKPRKKHRRLANLTNTLSFVMPAPVNRGLPLLMKFHTAVEMIAKGQHPGVNEWRDLADCINTMETLVDPMKLVTPKIMPTVKRAEAAMAAAAIRYRAGRGFSMDGLGLVAIRECVAFYADCMAELTERQMEHAQALTEKRADEYRARAADDREVIAL
jgi:hypothetical protein